MNSPSKKTSQKNGNVFNSYNQWKKIRNRCFLGISLCLFTIGYLGYDIVTRPTEMTQKKKMTFDDFLKDSFTAFSSDEADIFRSLHERSQSEFGELTNLSPEMFQKFTLSHTRLLIAQFRVYQGALSASELLPRVEELIHPDVRVIAVRYNEQPYQKLRHIWFPESVSDSRGLGTYVALGER